MKTCPYTNETMISAPTDYADEWIPTSFKPAFDKIREWTRTKRAQASFGPPYVVYQAHIDKLAAEIELFLTANPQHRERAKAMHFN